MRKTLYGLALLALSFPAFAQDAVVGTWKLNTQQTKYSAGTPPKDVNLSVTEEGGNLKVSAIGTNGDGSPIAAKYSLPVKGGTGTVEQGKDFDGVTSKVLDAHSRVNTFTKGGTLVRTRRVVVSPDGKTLRSTVTGKDSSGNTVKGTDVYDKQ